MSNECVLEWTGEYKGEVWMHTRVGAVNNLLGISSGIRYRYDDSPSNKSLAIKSEQVNYYYASEAKVAWEVIEATIKGYAISI